MSSALRICFPSDSQLSSRDTLNQAALHDAKIFVQYSKNEEATGKIVA